MKRFIILFLFLCTTLFAQKGLDWSDVSINYPTSKDDTTSIVYADSLDYIKSYHFNRILRNVRVFQDKLGLGSDTPGVAREVLIVNSTGDSTEWRVLEAADIPDLSATYGDMYANAVRDSIVDAFSDSSVSKLGQNIEDAEVDDGITVTESNDVDTTGTKIAAALGDRITTSTANATFVPITSATDITITNTGLNGDADIIFDPGSGGEVYIQSPTNGLQFDVDGANNVIYSQSKALVIGTDSGDDVTVQGGSLTTNLSGAVTLNPGTNVTLNPTGTTRIQSLDFPNSTGLEDSLELYLDLQDLQGAVIDGQVPNSITIDESNDVDTTGTKISDALSQRYLKDTTLFYIDMTLDRIGIGTNTPDQDLDILADNVILRPENVVSGSQYMGMLRSRLDLDGTGNTLNHTLLVGTATNTTGDIVHITMDSTVSVGGKPIRYEEDDSGEYLWWIEEDGKVVTATGFDASGAADLDYGSADVTDHTFITDGTGDAEIVLPAGSISGTEMLDSTITEVDLAATNTPTDNYVLTYNAAGQNFTWAVDQTGAGGSGSVTTVEDGDVQVGDADIVVLDFNGTRFAVTESPDTEVNIDIASVAGITGADEDDVTLADVQSATTNDFHNIGGTDDDVPEAGDFAAATDLDANGAINADAIGTAEFDDDANTPTAGDVVIVEVGAASFDYITPNAGTDITADLEEEVTEGSLANDVILEEDLKVVDTASDEDILTRETTTGDFEWHSIDQLLDITITGNGFVKRTGAATYVEDAQIGDTEIEDGAVDGGTGGEIADASITAADLADNSVDSGELVDGSIDESHLNATNAPTDNYVLTYNAAGTNFTWAVDATGGSADSNFVAITIDTLYAATGNKITLGTNDTLEVNGGAITGLGSLSGFNSIESDSANIDSLVITDWISLPTQDMGDVAFSGTTVTLDDDVVAPAEMADADHGDFTYATGVATLDAGVVSTSEIATDGVSADELNATGVEAELEAVLDLNELQGTITDAQIAAGAVDGGAGGEIADASITADDLADNSVDSGELVDGSIDESHLNATNVPTDNYVLTYNAAGTNFTWEADQTGGAPATADISDVSVTQTELAELETIGATTISANQWAALGSIAETLTGTEISLLDGITVLSGSNTGDDDQPDAGDFGNATDLDANGALNTNSVADNEIDYTAVNMDDMTDGSTNAAITLTQETNFETAYTHSQDNTQAHSDYVLNSGSDVMAGTLTADGLTLGANENITLGAQTLDHDGTDFVFSDNIQAPIKTASYSANQTLTAAQCYGGVIYVTGAATITLPAVADGMAVTVITVGAIAVSVDCNASDLMYLDGTALDDGDKATNTSTTGDAIVFTYYSSVGWYAMSNGWTDGGP